MAFRSWLLWVGVVAALSGGAALAQTTGGASATTTGTEDGTTGVQRRADLSAEEQVAEAERVQTNASNLSQRVTGMLDDARREGDVVRVTCLDDKLTQINAHNRTLSERIESLQEASTTSDDARRNHEFTVISVLSQNFQQLERDANECIGQSQFETGTTRVITEISRDTPSEDPTVLRPIPLAPIPYLPPPRSMMGP